MRKKLEALGVEFVAYESGARLEAKPDSEFAKYLAKLSKEHPEWKTSKLWVNAIMDLV